MMRRAEPNDRPNELNYAARRAYQPVEREEPQPAREPGTDGPGIRGAATCSLVWSFLTFGSKSFDPPARKLRKLDPAHLQEVAPPIGLLGFCDPLLIGRNNELIDGETRYEAAKQLGLDRVPCVRIDHLSLEEQRVLRLAANRPAEKGQWDLEALKIEFEELIVLDAPIEITGFSPAETDHVMLGDTAQSLEQGPLEPDPATAVARVGATFRLGPHRVICSDATDPAVLAHLLEGDTPARLVLTDEPYNVRIAGNVTDGAHREFAMASGEMSDAEFLAFNGAWMATVLPYLCDGAMLCTFIDWRGLPIVHSAASSFGLVPLNLIVWAAKDEYVDIESQVETTKVVANSIVAWCGVSAK